MLKALDAAEQATGETETNVIGYCIGGTLTASALAYMAATNDRRVAAATLFTTLLDFTEVGDMSVFIDEDQLRLLDEHMDRLGYLEGRHMAEAFNLLRENELIWFFVVNNYLLGREPQRSTCFIGMRIRRVCRRQCTDSIFITCTCGMS